MSKTPDLKQILSLAEAYEQQLPASSHMQMVAGVEIARLIDHTLLKPEATSEQIHRLCLEARELGFATVCVNPTHIPLAAGLLRDSQSGVCAVIAFPLGANLTASKVQEARQVLEAGASELDMVLNIGALKSEAHQQVLEDIHAVAEEAHGHMALLKVIIETALLTRREKILACLISQAAGAEYVKTSTGFSTGGATIEDVDLMRRVVGTQTGVKAADGIRTYQQALAMIQAGANRIGTSAGVFILQEASQQGVPS